MALSKKMIRECKAEFDSLKAWQNPTIAELREFAVGHFEEGHTVAEVMAITGIDRDVLEKWQQAYEDSLRPRLKRWQIKRLESLPGWKEFCEQDDE